MAYSSKPVEWLMNKEATMGKQAFLPLLGKGLLWGSTLLGLGGAGLGYLNKKEHDKRWETLDDNTLKSIMPAGVNLPDDQSTSRFANSIGRNNE